MSSLLHASPRVHPILRIVEPPAPPIEPCPSKFGRAGQWCYKLHPADMGEWCEDCLGGHDPEGLLPDWMGGNPMPEPDAPGEPRLPMADWIEAKAGEIRLLDSNLADWLAGKIETIADDCRWLGAETPDQFEERAAIMAGDLADRDREAAGIGAYSSDYPDANDL